jgi:hypothetical protein
VLWRHAAVDGLRAVRSPLLSTGAVAMPEDAVVLASDGLALDAVKVGDVLRLIDPRTGKIAAADERIGSKQRWGFADPAGWKCSPRYCAHHHRCPGGGRL